MWITKYLKSGSKDNKFGVPIANFGRINSLLYRGALPNSVGYNALADIGVETVINLIEGNQAEAQRLCRSAGIYDWIHIPMSDEKAPNPDSIRYFLKIVYGRPGPVFFGCKGNRHRGSLMGAIYRVVIEGYSKDAAWADQAVPYFYYDKAPFPFARDHSPLRKWFQREFDPDQYKEIVK
jgi:hypothetical protein